MNDLILLSAGALFALTMEGLYKFWQRSQTSYRLSQARMVLKNHKLTPVLYLSSVGIDDPELLRALDEFAFTGHIIVNANGEIVGKICPSAQKVKKPHLRLVVSNTAPKI